MTQLALLHPAESRAVQDRACAVPHARPQVIATASSSSSTQDNLANLEHFYEKMLEAANDDVALRSGRQPAVRKILMLQRVVHVLLRCVVFWRGTVKRLTTPSAHITPNFYDSNILIAVRQWLEPHADKCMPGLTVQRGIFDALNKVCVAYMLL